MYDVALSQKAGLQLLVVIEEGMRYPQKIFIIHSELKTAIINIFCDGMLVSIPVCLSKTQSSAGGTGIYALRSSVSGTQLLA